MGQRSRQRTGSRQTGTLSIQLLQGYTRPTESLHYKSIILIAGDIRARNIWTSIKGPRNLYGDILCSKDHPRSKSRVEKDVLNEVSIMQKLRHHHIASVQFHVFELDTYSIIMLPVAECDLRRFLRRCADAQFPRIELTHLTPWFGCLIGGLAFVHSKHIKHEDIKPSNILIKDHQPYLADFGCAKDFSGLNSSTSLDTLTFGTLVY